VKALTVRQPWADLIMAGVKEVENRTWPVPSTLPQWWACGFCCLPSRAHHRYDHETRFHVHQGTRFEFVSHDGPFPFRLGIHAAAKIDTDALGDLWPTVVQARGTTDLQTGVLLGTVQVDGCHHADECYSRSDSDILAPIGEGKPATYCSRWAEPDAYHWELSDPQPLDTPIPARGRLGLWTVPAGVSA